MEVTKDYMEYYAKQSLVYCYDRNVNRFQKSEEPDWQCSEMNIGMEVTEALYKEEGRKRHVINTYWGKGFDGSYIQEQIKQKYPEYDDYVSVVENMACFTEFYDTEHMNCKIQKISDEIVRKTIKLNDHYKKFKENWLYVFVPSLLAVDDIPRVWKSYQERITQYPILFNKIFLNAAHSIFVLNQDGLELEISVSEDCRKHLKEYVQKKF